MQKFTILVAVLIFVACGKKENQNIIQVIKPKVTENGRLIQFSDKKTADFFVAQPIASSQVFANITAPARVVATVVPSQESPNQNLVLFDNPELTSSYTLFLQHLANIHQIQNVTIKQRKIELDRAKDLQQHGAASGREVLEAQTALALEETNLINERAANLEFEAKLKLGGFDDPEELRTAQARTVWSLCDLPENQLSNISIGNKCQLNFNSYPRETFEGKIEDISDVVDISTRMVKARIVVTNPAGKLKAGMFGTAKFGLDQGKFLAVPKEAMITVMGKDYVFVKTGDMDFERRQVNAGQQANGNIIIFNGLTDQDKVVVKGAMQLKGLSFGY
ncbi:MAG TPA: efflux RND transporter periplasmic adaptor subunit [Cyclobacteriaceae bacterium]|jgi:multidrug efflux pump subunit AcrA (membrane-fusion protein)|nr:efflux RND transporter periplasmic adaptor subunit [Cyclobacteriaceae bacterium]